MSKQKSGNLTTALFLLLVTSGSFGFLIKEKGVSSVRKYPVVNDDVLPYGSLTYNFHDPSKGMVVLNADLDGGAGNTGEYLDASDRPSTFIYHETVTEDPLWKIAGRGDPVVASIDHEIDLQ
jgi:hypothetical protein